VEGTQRQQSVQRENHGASDRAALVSGNGDREGFTASDPTIEGEASPSTAAMDACRGDRGDQWARC
jgi:hypothetical protein